MQTFKDLEKLADTLGVNLSEDPSQDLLLFLGLAYNAASRIPAGLLEFKSSTLVLPAIKRAFIDALYVRRRIPNDNLDTTYISKFGKMYSYQMEAVKNGICKPQS